MSLFNFNINEQEKSEPQYKLHPAGNFKATLVDFKEAQSKTNPQNRYIMLILETPEGKINDVINYQNTNPDVTKRANSTLADALFAIKPEKSNYKDIEEMMNTVLGAELTIRIYHTKPKEGFNVESKVGGYYHNTKGQRATGAMPVQTKPASVENDLPF